MDFLTSAAILGILFLGLTVVLAVQSLAFGRRAIVQSDPRITSPGLLLGIDVLSALLLGLGVLVLLLIATLYWFIHGDQSATYG